MTESILDTLGLEQDEVYAKACDKGVKAYFDGVTDNTGVGSLVTTTPNPRNLSEAKTKMTAKCGHSFIWRPNLSGFQRLT
jgi:hypothetical protein